MAILKSRLFLKIMVSYVVLLLAVLVATYVYMAYRVHDNYIQLERQRLFTAAKILARALPVDHSMAGLQPWAEEFGARPVRITVIAADGRVLADNQGNPATMDNHSGRPEVQEAQRTGTGVSIRFSHTVEKNELYLAHRLEPKGDRGLVLRLALPLQEISQGFRSAQQGLLLIWIFLFLLALGLGYLFTRSLTGRIESIRESFSEKVAHGNLDARVKEVATDELGNLAESLNTTADALQGTIDALREEKNRVAAILEGMRAGVLAIDSEGRITLMNPVLGRILQADLKESLGKKLIEVVRNAELKGILDRVLADKKEVTATRNGSGHPAQF
jgi:two-component system phosphate regulon sensor histidine kinase PhoR